MLGQRRIPGPKLHDDREIRLLETLLRPGAFAGDWTTRDLHARVLARHQLTRRQAASQNSAYFTRE